jgi:hypothetical protein
MTTKVETWAKEADQGSRFVYHVGTFAGGDECRAAMDLYEGGLVLLVRKRRGKDRMFEYIAHRTGKKL